MAADSENVISQERYDALKEELVELEQEREEIGQQLRTAREFGDLSENAEYDAAREAQRQNTERIAEVSRRIANARILDVSKMSEEELANLSVSVGTLVSLTDEGGKALSVELVSTTETDSLANRISTESPLGEALIGRRAGDDVSFVTPSGKVRTYRITNVSLAQREADE